MIEQIPNIQQLICTYMIIVIYGKYLIPKSSQSSQNIAISLLLKN
jgi:hypothetical protein